MIVTLCGLIGSGKGTVADYLVSDYNFRTGSFASTLKDAVAAVFNWDRELLEGKTVQSREWREQVDSWWAKRLNIPHLTPRWVLQQWGTEVIRSHFHDEIWVASLENKLLHSGGNIVISDCRFQNEINALRNIGAKVVRVRRGPDPSWVRLGMSAANPKDPNQKQAQHELAALEIHASEWSWLATEFDVVIENSGSLDDLHSQIKSLVLTDSVSSAALTS